MESEATVRWAQFYYNQYQKIWGYYSHERKKIFTLLYIAILVVVVSVIFGFVAWCYEYGVVLLLSEFAFFFGLGLGVMAVGCGLSKISYTIQFGFLSLSRLDHLNNRKLTHWEDFSNIRALRDFLLAKSTSTVAYPDHLFDIAHRGIVTPQELITIRKFVELRDRKRGILLELSVADPKAHPIFHRQIRDKREKLLVSYLAYKSAVRQMIQAPGSIFNISVPWYQTSWISTNHSDHLCHSMLSCRELFNASLWERLI